MTFSLYDASVPMFVRGLDNLSAILEKAAASGLDEAALMEARLARTPGLKRIGAEDWFAVPADHVVTRYEEKKLGDTAPIFLEFEREA